MAINDENDLRPHMNTIETILLETRREEPEAKEKTFRPFLFFGLKTPIIHRPGLYLHLCIVSLQYFSFLNTNIILRHAFRRTFHSEFDNNFFFPLLSTLAYLILPFIVYFCDRQMIRRYYLVLVCLVMAFLSSCFLLTFLTLEKFQTLELSNKNTSDVGIIISLYTIPEKIFVVFSSTFFSISFVLSAPFTIAFGLDILHGTHFETLLLYFPLFYISRNIGGTFAYLLYIREQEEYSYIHCSISTFVMLISVLLLIIGRLCGFFKDSALVANNFSFKRGIKLIFSALKLKFIYKKRADLKSLMLYTGTKNNYHDPKSLVSRTVAMVKINLIFIILIPLLGSYQILYELFPGQLDLNFSFPDPTFQNTSTTHCNKGVYFYNYIITNGLTIVVFVVVFEFFFNDIVFNVVRQDLPRWIRCIPRCLLFIRNNCLYGMRKKLHAYLTLVDPILKRVFWGLPFGLLSVLCALTVEILRINFTFRLNCTASEQVHYGSHVPLIAQVPQYIFCAMQETISLIGLLQYVYYLCSKHFQNSLRGFFFSLFFFYYGVASFVANLVCYSLIKICSSECYASDSNDSWNQFCFVFIPDCNKRQPQAYLVWILAIVLYLIMIPLFYGFSHYKHWRIVRVMKQAHVNWNGGELIINN